MSSPFQQKFSGKSPFRNEGVVTLSEQDIKNAKSASSQPAKEISYEGQGGKDYENRPEDATNPEGQGGIDYESKDYKKKTEISPLNSYADGGRGEVYLSDQPAFQQLQGQVQGALDSFMNESNESKANRLQGRLDNRDSRNDTRSNMDDFDPKTTELINRQARYQDAAVKDKKQKKYKKNNDGTYSEI